MIRGINWPWGHDRALWVPYAKMDESQDTDTFLLRQGFHIADERFRVDEAFTGFFKEKEIGKGQAKTGSDRFQCIQAGTIAAMLEIGKGGLADPGFLSQGVRCPPVNLQKNTDGPVNGHKHHLWQKV